MPDIEKVIEAIENCNDRDSRDCKKCQFKGKDTHDCAGELMSNALALLKEQQAEIERIKRQTGEWKRMSDLPIDKDDQFECSNCGNVVHYKDRVNLYTFNDFCGRCGSYNGFKFK